MKKPKTELLEYAVFTWFMQKRASGQPISSPLLCKKALFKIHNLWQVVDGWETLIYAKGFDKLRFMEKSWVQMSLQQIVFS